MSESPSREEVNAKLEAVEARLETRLVSMDGKMDILLNEIRHVGKTSEEAKREASSVKWHVLFACLAVLGVILAMWAVGVQIADIVRQVTVPVVKTDSPWLKDPVVEPQKK